MKTATVSRREAGARGSYAAKSGVRSQKSEVKITRAPRLTPRGERAVLCEELRDELRHRPRWKGCKSAPRGHRRRGFALGELLAHSLPVGVLIGLLLALLAGGLGCSHLLQGVNSTEAVKAIAAAEAQAANGTQTPIALDVLKNLTGDDFWSGRVLLIPPATGLKDVEFTIQDRVSGAVIVRYKSSRSAVIDTLLARIAGIDQGKQGFDLQMTQMLIALLERTLDRAERVGLPLIQQAQQPHATTAGAGGFDAKFDAFVGKAEAAFGKLAALEAAHPEFFKALEAKPPP